MKKKTWSDVFEPFTQIGNIDLHLLTRQKGYTDFGIVANGKEWVLRISPKGKTAWVYKYPR